MFAIIEFNNNRKEFFVVPLIWLSDDKTSCFWPKNISSEKRIHTMVEELTPPKDTWTEYPVRKVHNTAETFSQANTALQLILAETSTSTSVESERQDVSQILNVETAQIFELIQNNEDSGSEKCGNDSRSLKRKRKISTKRAKTNTDDKYSSDSEDHRSQPVKRNITKVNTLLDFTSTSDEDLLHEHNINSFKPTQKATPTVLCSKKGEDLAEDRTKTFNEIQVSTNPLKRLNQFTKQRIGISSPAHNYKGLESPITTLRSNCSTASTGSNIDLTSNIQSLNQWQQNVLQELTRIKMVQEQQSTLLTQIWQTLQVKNVQALQRPPDVPDFPVDRKRDFSTLEEWLEIPQNFIYMRTRLASIGGSTIRSAVMNMLKFVISNRVGMAFNWAGSAPKSPGQQKKYSFRETLIYKALNEAAKISFQGKDQVGGIALVGEITDKAIGQACQDWLKLSKQRYMNSTTRNK